MAQVPQDLQLISKGDSGVMTTSLNLIYCTLFIELYAKGYKSNRFFECLKDDEGEWQIWIGRLHIYLSLET